MKRRTTKLEKNHQPEEQAELVAETPASEQPQAPAEDELAKAQALAATARAEADDYKRKWYSVTAEYDNYRKRTAATRSQAYAEGRADVVSKLFPIADNLERALASCSDANTQKGISMVMAAFRKLLEEEKISVIDPVGEEFSAEKCEAILAVDAQEGEKSGTVKQVFAKGYEQNGKVLRFAQVAVIK